MDEQIAYYEDLLREWYDLETGKPLDVLDPYPTEVQYYLSLKEAKASGIELAI